MVKIEMYDFIKRMLFEWDSDYTKVTEQEREKSLMLNPAFIHSLQSSLR